MLDASEILPGRLWQGAKPYPEDVHAHRFDLVVFCADEFQPRRSAYPSAKMLHAPNDDSGRPPTEKELQIAKNAARVVAHNVRYRQKVLVTCMAGLNRSGLVTAWALAILTGWSGQKCVEYVRQRRPDALFNSHFANFLYAIPERKAHLI